MKWPRLALACAAAALAALGLTGLTQSAAKASGSSTLVDGPTVNTGEAGECLGVLGGNMANDTPVVTWTCNGHADQTWELSGGSTGAGFQQIENSQDPSKCLGVRNSATGNGANLVIWDCNGNSDQLWKFVPWTADNRNGPFGCFTIQNSNANPKVIGVLGGTPSDSAQTVIWDPLTGLTHHDQVWCQQ